MSIKSCESCRMAATTATTCNEGHYICSDCIKSYSRLNINKFLKYIINPDEKFKEDVDKVYKDYEIKFKSGNKEPFDRIVDNYISNVAPIPSVLCPVCNGQTPKLIPSRYIDKYLFDTYGIDISEVRRSLIEEHGNIINVIDHINKK